VSGDISAETEFAGEDWTIDQLDIIVADHFNMLGNDLPFRRTTSPLPQ